MLNNFSKSSFCHFLMVASRGQCVIEFHMYAFIKLQHVYSYVYINLFIIFTYVHLYRTIISEAFLKWKEAWETVFFNKTEDSDTLGFSSNSFLIQNVMIQKEVPLDRKTLNLISLPKNYWFSMFSPFPFFM